MFNLFHFSLNWFLFILLYNEIKLINCSRIPPWFIYNEHLYYVELSLEFTSYEAREKCLKLGMTMSSSQNDAAQLMSSLERTYGYLPNFWIFDNENLNNVFNIMLLVRTCFKFESSVGIYSSENCSTQMGYFCKCGFNGATLFYRNGTIEQIAKNKVQEFCNPHEVVYDEVLSNCAIHLNKTQRYVTQEIKK